MTEHHKSNIYFQRCGNNLNANIISLRKLLDQLEPKFTSSDKVGIKIHWGERDNISFLPADYTAEIVNWVKSMGAKPFVFDTTVLYSGGRRDAESALKTAREHGFTPQKLGCPVVIGDGSDGTDVIDIPSGYKHFPSVQVTSLIESTDAFVIFSHFKGHLLAGFGGAIKNISMGFASRAQKQRMHADVQPQLNTDKCTRCGKCAEICPQNAIEFHQYMYPNFELDKCIGCAQCIGICPQVAIKVQWNVDKTTFQERLVETAAAVWNIIHDRTLLITAAINITKECDCMSGENPRVYQDVGFLGGYNPVILDRATIDKVGEQAIEKAHSNLPWRKQFTFATQIGFVKQ